MISFQRKNGRWLEVASLPLDAGARARVWRDVTEEQGGAGPRSSSARALDALCVGYAVFDAGGRFVNADERCQELFPGISDLARAGTRYQGHLARMRALAPAHRPAPVVLSGDTLAPRPERPAEPGARLLDKPIDPRQRLRAVREALASR